MKFSVVHLADEYWGVWNKESRKIVTRTKSKEGANALCEELNRYGYVEVDYEDV